MHGDVVETENLMVEHTLSVSTRLILYTNPTIYNHVMYFLITNVIKLPCTSLSEGLSEHVR